MSAYQKFRLTLTDIFDLKDDTDKYAKIINRIIYFLIISSTVAVILETIPFFKNTYDSPLFLFETAVTIVFTCEFFLRFLVIDLLLNQHKTKLERGLLFFYLFIDIISVFPPLFFLIYDGQHHDYFLTLRLLRIFKAFRHDRSMELVLRAVMIKKNELLKSFILVFISTVFLSVLLYEVENDFEFGESETKTPFTDIFTTFAWSSSVFVNDVIGYQNMGIIPVSSLGRAITWIIGFLNIAILVIPTGIIASGYLEVVEENKIKEKYEHLQNAFRKKYNKVLGIHTYERPHTIFTLRNALFINENHLYKMLETTNGFRMRAVQSAEGEKYNDTNLIEFFGYDHLMEYGAKILQEQSNLLILVPESFFYKGLGYFSYCTAAYLGANLISNERFQENSLNPTFDLCFLQNPDYHKNTPYLPKDKAFKKLPLATRAFASFKNDLATIAKNKTIFIFNSCREVHDEYRIKKVNFQANELKKWLEQINPNAYLVDINAELLEGYGYYQIIKSLAQEINEICQPTA